MRSLFSFFFLVLLLVFAACSDPVSVDYGFGSGPVERDTTAVDDSTVFVTPNPEPENSGRVGLK